MSAILEFDEVILDPGLFNVGAATGGHEFANSNIRSPVTGVSRVAILRYDPALVWNVNFADVNYDPGNPDNASLDYFNNIWLGGFGSAYGLRVRVEFDHKAIGEVIGAGNGSLQDFKLTKTYQRPGTTSHPYIRRIIKPVCNTKAGPNPVFLSAGSVTLYEPNGTTPRVVEVPFKVFLDDAQQNSGWTINNTTGDLHFASPPGAGVSVSVDMQIDYPMQFWTNTYSMKAEFPGEVSGLQMIEVLPASLGIT